MWNTKRTLSRFMLIYILVFSVVTWNVEQRWQVTVVAAAVSQARTEAARGFAASLYGRPKGMELAIFNDLFFFFLFFFFRFWGSVWSPRRSFKQSAHTTPALPAFLLSLQWCQLGAEYGPVGTFTASFRPFSFTMFSHAFACYLGARIIQMTLSSYMHAVE